MTGFAASEALAGSQKLVWEIRSVNHRYLDLGFRLPEEFRGLEPRLRSLAGEAVKRGKVDCSLRVSAIGGGEPESGVDLDRVGALRRLETRIREQWPDARPFSTFEILRWPGVLKDEAGERETLMAPALSSFEEALDSLRSARAREGQRLGEMLMERVAALEALMTAIGAQLAQAAPRYRDRLLERLARLDVEANPERLEQELALVAQRTDVTEEADRLSAHLKEIRDVLAQDEPVGRRLDFLIQELNREANTLASKVQDDELARKAVDLKVLIEQMREQAQNVE